MRWNVRTGWKPTSEREQVPFEVRHHPGAITAQEVAASEHVPGKMLAKTVMVLADGKISYLRCRLPTT